jgi:hypothetical protein
MSPDIGSTLRFLRESVLEASQVKLCEAIDMSQTHLSLVEGGTYTAGPTMLGRLEKLLGIDLYVLSWMEEQDDARYEDMMAEMRAKAKKRWNER